MQDNDARINALLATLESDPNANPWDILAVRHTISLLRGGPPMSKARLTGGNKPITSADLAQCPSQRQALYEIAYRNAGVVKVNWAADLIIAAGLSKSAKSTLSSTLWKALDESHNWEYIGPGKFKLTGFKPKPNSHLAVATGRRRSKQAAPDPETQPPLL